jgi:hypothetical protein
MLLRLVFEDTGGDIGQLAQGVGTLVGLRLFVRLHRKHRAGHRHAARPITK